MADPSALPGRCGSPLPGKNRGRFCGQPAGQRTDHKGLGHCWLHGGRQETFDSPRVKADILDNMRRFGTPRAGLDPREGLLEEIARTAGHIAWLESELDRVDGPFQNPDELHKGIRSVTRRVGTAMTPSGILEPVDETTTVLGPGIHILWKLYQDERAHFAALCAKATALGLAEREVRIRETEAVLAAKLVIAVINDLSLTEDQRGLVPALVRQHYPVLRSAD